MTSFAGNQLAYKSLAASEGCAGFLSCTSGAYSAGSFDKRFDLHLGYAYSPRLYWLTASKNCSGSL